MTTASEYMDSANTAINALDVPGAASYLRLAADEVDLAAVGMEADPSISGPMYAAADDYRLAASQSDAFEITAATRSLSRGATEIGAATRAVNASAVPFC
jgi:hypothetical protein